MAGCLFLLVTLSLACQQEAAVPGQASTAPEEQAVAAGPGGANDGAEAGVVQSFGGIEFAWMPPGAYQQGSSEHPQKLALRFYGAPEWYSDEWPQQERRFSQGFWMSKTEITLGQWIDVMGKAPGNAAGSLEALDMPVAQVTWEDAHGFAETLSSNVGSGSFRLPTEAEWEYGCRAGSETAFFFGDDPAELPEYAWCRTNAPDGAPRPVGGLAANPWGLHDMLGNVWEWTADVYHLYEAPGVRQAPGHRAIRGGAANSTAPYLRAAFRVGMPEETRSNRLGFRLVYEP